jgi:hypothetical protein
VGRSERPGPNQPTNGRAAGDRGNDRGHAGLVTVERRKETRYRAGQQGLARARRADHDQTMAAGKRQLQSTSGLELTAHLGEVRPALLLDDTRSRSLGLVPYFRRHLDPRRCAARPTPPRIADEHRRLREGRRWDDLDSAGQSRFDRSIVRNHYPPDVPAGECRNHRQQARDGTQLAAQRELPQYRPPSARANLLGADENSERDRQVQ